LNAFEHPQVPWSHSNYPNLGNAEKDVRDDRLVRSLSVMMTRIARATISVRFLKGQAA
jgi:hypothetical protein